MRRRKSGEKGREAKEISQKLLVVHTLYLEGGAENRQGRGSDRTGALMRIKHQSTGTRTRPDQGVSTA